MGFFKSRFCVFRLKSQNLNAESKRRIYKFAESQIKFLLLRDSVLANRGNLFYAFEYVDCFGRFAPSQ
ncbi:hypothetical protein ACWIUD_08440 [Helicobacter sp. 23-1044]